MYKPGQYSYQMGYTLPEFSRALHAGFTAATSAWECQDISSSEWLLCQRHGPFRMRIAVLAQPPRKLGLLTLPVLLVTFSPVTDDGASEKIFFESFFKYFHKGGG